MKTWNWFFAEECSARLGIAQRAAYQRLILLAHAILMIIAILFSIFICTLGRITETDRSHTPTTAFELATHESNAGKLSPRGQTPLSKHSGFAGFVSSRVRIIPDDNRIPRIPNPRRRYQNDANSDGLTEFSYSPVFGSNTGAFGSTANDSSEPYLYAQIESRFNWENPVNRHIGVAYVEHPEYPRIAKRFGNRKQGTVTVLVLIDSTGKMIPFSYRTSRDSVNAAIRVSANEQDNTLVYLVNEDPKGWWFFEKLRQALPKWAFAPAIQNGRPVNRLLEITYRYCLDPECVTYRVKEMQDDIYVYPAN